MPEQETHDVGLVQPVLGGIYRRVCAAVLDGRDYGLENFMSPGGADFSLQRWLQPTFLFILNRAGHRLKPMLQAEARATSQEDSRQNG